MKKLSILTGASGAGKTTIIKEASAIHSDIKCLHFDDIDIPPVSKMIDDFGSQEEWQKNHTLEWMKLISQDYLPQHHVLFEGQMRLAFIKEAIDQALVKNKVNIYLVDCSDEERFRRLTEERNQAELCTEEMRNWAAFLRNEAISLGTPIINTDHLQPKEVLQKVIKGFDDNVHKSINT